MALEGSIRDFSLADIFQLIGIQRKTGILTLRQRDEEVKVSFLNGMVVNADSKGGKLDDRLGSVLVKSGKLSQDNLTRALKLQKETLKKLGHVLIDSELVRPEDLRDALGIQITQIVYRLFRWKDGQYHFEQDVNVDYDKENFTPMSAESILMEGMRMIDEWPIIERKITSYDLVFEPVPLEGEAAITEDGAGSSRDGAEDDFDLIFGDDEDQRKKKKAPVETPAGAIKLTREENLVYSQLNGKVTVQEVIDRTMLSEFEICRALYDLSNRNLITPVEREKKKKAGKEKPRRGAGPSAARLLAAALGAWLVAIYALGLTRLNPLNLVHAPPAANPSLDDVTAALARNRLRRLAEAVDLYTLLEQAAPASLDDLVRVGLVSERELRDPWHGEIGFELAHDRVVLTSASSRNGAASPPISVEHPLRR